jgi:hypothetical protein
MDGQYRNMLQGEGFREGEVVEMEVDLGQASITWLVNGQVRLRSLAEYCGRKDGSGCLSGKCSMNKKPSNIPFADIHVLEIIEEFASLERKKCIIL